MHQGLKEGTGYYVKSFDDLIIGRNARFLIPSVPSIRQRSSNIAITTGASLVAQRNRRINAMPLVRSTLPLGRGAVGDTIVLTETGEATVYGLPYQRAILIAVT
jgi:hypothetical protein